LEQIFNHRQGAATAGSKHGGVIYFTKELKALQNALNEIKK
jgi:hypothetical protein